MSTAGAPPPVEAAAVWIRDVMDGLAAPDVLPAFGPGPSRTDALAAVDGYRRLFSADFAGAVEQVRAVAAPGPHLRAVRRQVEALCTATVTDVPDVPDGADVDLGTVAGAMAVFHTCEAAHVAGDLAACVRLAREALDTGSLDQRSATWIRLALVRGLLFQGDVVGAATELALVDATTPLSTQAVRCLQALVAGLQGDTDVVVDVAEQMCSLIVAPRTYADAGLALMGAFGLAASGLPAAAAELLRFGAGGSGLPLLPMALRAYGYDLLLEAALAGHDGPRGENLGLAQWLMADFDRLDLGGNAHLEAAREAARARLSIATGEVGAGLATAVAATARAVAGGSELIGLRAVLAAAQAGPDGLAPVSAERVLDLLAEVGSADLQGWMERELAAGGRRPRPLPGVGWDRLTPAQRVVARLAARGLRNAEIADLLVVSPRTVEVHVAAVLDVLGVDNRVGIVGSVATARDEPDPDLLALLTPRGRDVARGIAAGRSNAEIAAALGIGTKAVEKHVSGVLRALAVGSRAGAAARLLGADPDHPLAARR